MPRATFSDTGSAHQGPLNPRQLLARAYPSSAAYTAASCDFDCHTVQRYAICFNGQQLRRLQRNQPQDVKLLQWSSIDSAVRRSGIHALINFPPYLSIYRAAPHRDVARSLLHFP